jgi:hypothetical protein
MTHLVRSHQQDLLAGALTAAWCGPASTRRRPWRRSTAA